MNINTDSVLDLITRAQNQPNETLALVGERYQALREVQWPALRWHFVQLSLPSSYRVVNNDMSVVFTNGSRIRCYSADRSGQMHGLRFTDILFLEAITESELICLIKAGIIPHQYVPPLNPVLDL